LADAAAAAAAATVRLSTIAAQSLAPGAASDSLAKYLEHKGPYAALNAKGLTLIYNLGLPFGKSYVSVQSGDKMDGHAFPGLCMDFRDMHSTAQHCC
jgi:hypothetical protein